MFWCGFENGNCVRSMNVKRKKSIQKSDTEEENIIELAEEFLNVTTREQVTGRVRVRVYTEEQERIVDEPLEREDITVTRVPVGRIVEHASGIQQQGNTTIIPVYEEVVVTEKKLVLKEEIHLTRSRRTERDPQSITVRREHAEIERHPGPQPAPSSEHAP